MENPLRCQKLRGRAGGRRDGPTIGHPTAGKGSRKWAGKGGCDVRDGDLACSNRFPCALSNQGVTAGFPMELIKIDLVTLPVVSVVPATLGGQVQNRAPYVGFVTICHDQSGTASVAGAAGGVAILAVVAELAGLAQALPGSRSGTARPRASRRFG